MKEIKFCLNCGAPLDSSLHGNSGHCPDGCTYQRKLQRNREKYQQVKATLEAFERADKLLGMYYEVYSGDRFIDAIVLDIAGMDWSITRSEIILDSLPVKVLGNYGYCLFTNETLKIWNLSSNQ